LFQPPEPLLFPVFLRNHQKHRQLPSICGHGRTGRADSPRLGQFSTYLINFEVN
jgi:hypothetical protein